MRRPTVCIHIIAVILTAALPLRAQETRSVPVTNGGFESGMDNWEGGGSISHDVVHEGKSSLLLEKGSVLQPPGKKQLVAVDRKHDYRLTVWIKTQGVPEDGASVTVAAAGGPNEGDTKWLGGWLEGSNPQYVHDNGASPALLATGGTHDWKQFETFISGKDLHKDARYLLIYLRMDARKPPEGKAWFDDLSVQELEAGSAPQRQGPLVRNGGFEQGSRGWGGKGFQIVHERAAAGKSALTIDGGHALQAGIPVQGGQRYRVSMKIRTDGLSGEPGYVQYSFRGGPNMDGWHGPVQLDKGNHAEPALFITGTAHDWKQFSAVISTPKAANQLLIYLRKDGGPGSVSFDEVAMEKTDEPVTAPGALRQAGMAPPRPLLEDTDFAQAELANTGFETGDSGWLVTGVSEVSARDAADGSHSLEMVNGQAVQGLKADDKKNYLVTVKIKTSAVVEEGASVRLVFRGPRTLGREATARPIRTGGTHDWRTFSAAVAVPKSATDMLIYLDKAVDDGTAWFDALSVAPTDQPAIAQEGAPDNLLPPPAEGTDATAALAKIVAAGQAGESGALALTADGKANYAIHVGSAQEPIALHAAEELADYLGRISGADFAPLSHDANPIVGRPLIVIGRNNALIDKLIPNLPYDALGEDGFIIRAVGPHLVVTGATPRGTLYGVYWLLDHKLGVKWYSPEYTFVPHSATLTLDRMDERQKPHFVYREIFNRDTDNPQWRQRNLLNGNSHHRAFAHPPKGIDTWSTYWPEVGGHNFQSIVSFKAYGEEHPDWFAGGQLAMMNPDVRRIAAEQLVKLISKRKEKGQAASYAFSQEDRGWAPDPASQAFAKAHGGALAAPVVDMVADVAAQVRKEIPDARLSTLAYHWSFPAPTEMRVPDYVLITVAPIEADFGHPFDSAANRQTADDIAGWAAIAGNIVIWDYIANFGSYLQPYPTIEPMFRNIQWLSRFPAIQGYFGQGSYGTVGAEFAELRAWVAARLTWDPAQDPRALMGEFLRGYYGDAAPYIQQYLDLMSRSVQETGTRLMFRTQVTAPYLSFEVLRQADALMDQAQAAVADAPGFDRRVQTVRMGVDYVILLRRADYVAAAKQAGVTWEPQTSMRLARFAANVAASGMKQYGEGVGSVAGLIHAMGIERRVPEAPPFVSDLPRSAWVDNQDLDVRLYSGKIVADPLASDGGALTMPGQSATWGVQMPLDNLPTDGQWTLHARVRVDPNPDAEPTARAFSVGVHPGQSMSPRVSDVADGQYHWFQVPGTYRHDPGRALWFAPPKSSAIGAMYIDRVVAVRAK